MRRSTLGPDIHARRAFPKDNDGAFLEAKVALRRRALREAPGGVLDCFAGRGALWRIVWNEAPSYRGIEKDMQKALAHPGACFHCAADEALRALDLSRFTIFDMDAYGSPWGEIEIIAARRKMLPGERIAIVITDGSVRRALMGLTNHALARLADAPPEAPGAHHRWTLLARRALEEVAARMGGRLVALDESDALHQGRGIWHACALFEGISRWTMPSSMAPPFPFSGGSKTMASAMGTPRSTTRGLLR
jgi:TusA-related sulfurtransferase